MVIEELKFSSFNLSNIKNYYIINIGDVMKKESLIKARQIIIDALEKNKIDEVDKIELIINLNNFLKEEEYDKNIKLLRKKNKNGI